mmetsp:Transcript_81947/g.171478  ORF Transcript_81947/g.171478 Transcript_81947/m.171478 type:complete len:204 (+) Transcript_81947:2392-3003(+)
MFAGLRPVFVLVVRILEVQKRLVLLDEEFVELRVSLLDGLQLVLMLGHRLLLFIVVAHIIVIALPSVSHVMESSCTTLVVAILFCSWCLFASLGFCLFALLAGHQSLVGDVLLVALLTCDAGEEIVHRFDAFESLRVLLELLADGLVSLSFGLPLLLAAVDFLGCLGLLLCLRRDFRFRFRVANLFFLGDALDLRHGSSRLSI